MNLFEQAKSAPTKASPKVKAKKEKAEVVIPGMEDYSALCSVMGALEAIQKTLGLSVKSTMLAEFIKTGMAAKRRPENFKGVEGDAEASCELRLRSSASPLRPDEIELLNEHDIPVRVDDVVVETFVINPAYAGNQEILEKVSKALAKVPGLPKDFIQHQSQKKTCASEESIDAVLRIEDRAVVEQLLPLVTTTAIKARMTGEDADKRAFEIVGKLLNPAEVQLKDCEEAA